MQQSGVRNGAKCINNARVHVTEALPEREGRRQPASMQYARETGKVAQAKSQDLVLVLVQKHLR
jgi:hypothetical protein